MMAQISIIIEKNESSYVAYCPEIEGSKTQGDSLDTVINDIKEIIKPYFNKNENTKNNSFQPDGIQTLLELVEQLTSDMTPEEIIKSHLSKNEDEANNKVDKPIWEIAQELVADITEEELQQLPIDGAEQHDHYIYGIPKREG